MALLLVGANETYRTIGAAIAAAQPGDVVEVLPGIYRESVGVNKAITLRGHDGAIVDGGWDGRSLTNTYGGTIGIRAEGATVEGMAVRNCPGRGIGIAASHVTVRGCDIAECYKGGLGANPPAGEQYSGLLVEGNIIQHVGLERLVTGAGKVNGSFLFTDVTDSVMRNNLIVNGLGEGINIDRASARNLFEGNTVINCAHVGIYINCAQNNTVRGNVVVYSGAPKPVGKVESAPAGIIIGDEGGASKKFPKSAGNVIEGNIVIGSGRLFQVRNNPNNYDTIMDDNTRVIGNTFIAGPKTTRGIDIADNVQGRAHGAAEIAYNVIEFTHAAPDAAIASKAAAALNFHHNGWSHNPAKAAQGEGDYIGALGLTNPGAALHAEWGALDVGYDPDNYRPQADSPVKEWGALEPRPVEPPPPPPNPNLWIAERLSAIWGRLEEVGLEVGALADEVDALAAEIEPGE